MKLFCFTILYFISKTKHSKMYFTTKMTKELHAKQIFSSHSTPIKTTTRPIQFKKTHLIDVINLQPTINRLLLTVNEQWYSSDSMFKILKHIIKNKKRNEIEVLFVRSDYLLEERIDPKKEDIMKLVEFNTVACAFPIYSSMVNEIHAKDYNTYVSESRDKFINLIVTLENIFTTKYKIKNSIAILISQDDKNSNEKRFIKQLLKLKNIELHILTYKEMSLNGSFKEDIYYYQDNPVFLVYYRWFYNSDQYLKSDIDFRIQLENSRTVSLPSAEIQLAGHKHFQVLLNNVDLLNKYCTEDETLRLMNHFTEYKSKTECVNKDYLVKKYGEGGNNVFESVEEANSIFEKSGMADEDYFFMKRINSPIFINQFNNEEDCEVVPEIGIFGGLISVDGEVVLNEYMGYLCRTKKRGALECGVSSGYGALDSLELVD